MNAQIREVIAMLAGYGGRKPLAELLSAYRANVLATEYYSVFGEPEDRCIELITQARGRGSKRGPILSGFYSSADKRKDIVAISSMIGCPKSCPFCPLGSRAFLRSLTVEEMLEQVLVMLQIAARTGSLSTEDCKIEDCKIEDCKITVAKCGEPLLNRNVVTALSLLAPLGMSYKFSTILPEGKIARESFDALLGLATEVSNPLQLQVSLLSTDDEQRQALAGGAVMKLSEIAEQLQRWVSAGAGKRLPNLSITFHEACSTRVDLLERYLSPALVNIRFRPYIPTDTGRDSGLEVARTEQSAEFAEALKAAGYRVSFAGVASPIEQRFCISSVSEISIYEARQGLSK